MRGGISDLIDSDMENAPGFIDENSILSSASDTSYAATSKQTTGQKKPPKKRHRVTMPKPKTKVTKPSEEPTTKRNTKKPTAAKRKALEEHVNEARDEGEVVELLEVEDVKPKQKSKPRARKVPQKPLDEEGEDDMMEIDQTPAAASSRLAQTKKKAPKVTKKSSTVVPTKPVQQPVTQVEEDAPADISSLGPLPPPRHHSKMRTEGIYRGRAGSLSDNERGDPNLRRKLGDVTRKFENVELKYQNLKEVGIYEATANFDRLKQQCDATTAASNELVASLKKELEAQAPLVSESRKATKDLQNRDTELSSLKQKNAELTSSMTTAQNEIKALQAKLAASRAASVLAETANTKAPVSAAKPETKVRTIVSGSAEAIQAAQTAQMKEDLYSDLTGLIIRSAKRTGEGDTFDCLQTGRNGSKLPILMRLLSCANLNCSTAFQVVH